MSYLAWSPVRALLWALTVGVALVGAGITLASRQSPVSIQDRGSDEIALNITPDWIDLVDEMGESLLSTQAVDPLQDFLRGFRRQFGGPPVQAAASAYLINGSP
jgi:hypothetical protein